MSSPTPTPWAAVLPAPAFVEQHEGAYQLPQPPTIALVVSPAAAPSSNHAGAAAATPAAAAADQQQQHHAQLHRHGRWLAERLAQRFGLEPSVIDGPGQQADITLVLAAELPAAAAFRVPEEAYELVVAASSSSSSNGGGGCGGATIAATAPAGVFYGVQTLLQALEAAAAAAAADSGGDGSGGPDGGGAVGEAAAAAAGPPPRLPCARLLDGPRFPWRGLLLDAGRHFFPTPFVLKVLDLMALYKMNRFHWHLTEDQGWRLDVPALPRLASVAAWRGGASSASPSPPPALSSAEEQQQQQQQQQGDGVADASASAADSLPQQGQQQQQQEPLSSPSPLPLPPPPRASAAAAVAAGVLGRGAPSAATPHGGCYSVQDVAAVVAYAAERHIEVVPEVELPGHCCAALAAYPELSCTGAVRAVSTHWGIHEDVYCAGSDAVFDFLGQVLEQVVAQFPCRYVHVGGDEVPKGRWEACARCQGRVAAEGVGDAAGLQSWFVRRVSAFLAQRGRRLIGWDEILEGGLAEGATVMSWRGNAGGVIAARAGHDVIMTPTSHCYFDYRQGPSPSEPGAWYAVLPLRTVYAFDPIPSAAGGNDGGLLGAAAAWAGTGSGEAQPTPTPVLAPAAAAATPPLSPLQQQQHAAAADAAAAAGQREPGGGSGGGSPSDEEMTSAGGGGGGGGGSSDADSAGGGGGGHAQTQQPAMPRAAMSAGGRSDADMPPAAASPGSPGGSSGGDAAAATNAAATPTPTTPTAASPLLPPAAPGGNGAPPPPPPLLTEAEAARVLGSQANLWTEYVPDEATAEYMLLPRLPALAEAVWSPAAGRDWRRFRAALAAVHLPLLASLGYTFRPLDDDDE